MKKKKTRIEKLRAAYPELRNFWKKIQPTISKLMQYFPWMSITGSNRVTISPAVIKDDGIAAPWYLFLEMEFMKLPEGSVLAAVDFDKLAEHESLENVALMLEIADVLGKQWFVLKGKMLGIHIVENIWLIYRFYNAMKVLVSN